MFREKQVNNRIGEWLGPCTVKGIDADRKLLYIQDTDDGPANAFGFAQIKPYLKASNTANTLFVDLNHAFAWFKNGGDDDENYNHIEEVFLTEVLKHGDHRATAPEMDEAKKREIRGLFDRGTFRVVAIEDITPDANVLPGRFVLAVKTNDGVIKHKARFVIGGHRDKMKRMIVHSSQNIQPSTV